MPELQTLDPVAETIITFLHKIGLTVRYTALDDTTFLPGLHLEPGGLVVDPEKLKYPGDLLHEAGHLAVMTPERRSSTGQKAGDDLGDEIGAQCWSYAAAMHLRLPPQVVFHLDGYKGAADALIGNYSSGTIGVPLLQWMGLTLDTQRAAAEGKAPYPVMQRWLRQE
ncbi:hypothetical protein GOB94_11885 [Granulicella sp. 5B5]|uniref:hypothetical protein n=1 Tax=Granulicella sp. 5B5 TaxID=1617967 RepID=UPI0015F5BE54|nr:hypothetical protein [Granulicella sp. 5B5]QMV19304.1 hypothetical protein GOB94_11885 [Granulicella sp. 5B5]